MIELKKHQSSILQYAMPELLMVVGAKNEILYDSTEILPLQRLEGQWKISDKLMKAILKDIREENLCL